MRPPDSDRDRTASRDGAGSTSSAIPAARPTARRREVWTLAGVTGFAVVVYSAWLGVHAFKPDGVGFRWLFVAYAAFYLLGPGLVAVLLDLYVAVVGDRWDLTL